MKVCILGDTHFGVRNDSLMFLDYGEKFYNEVFFPYLIENNIDTLIQLGDLFDRRKYINFNTLSRTRTMFLDRLRNLNIKTYILVGNHDTTFKNTNNINSPDILLKEYENIVVISKPQTIKIDDIPFCMVPWICSENFEESIQEMNSSQADICIGHFEIAGFEMHRGMPSNDGLNRDLFNRFDIVLSGHYHHKSQSGNITYVGTPMEMTWQDFDDQRGFHLFDLNARKLEFIPNPNIMFHKIVYDDKVESISDITGKDLSKYTNAYVKVIVINKTNPYLFDKFITNLYEQNPADVTIAEDFTDLTEGVDDDMIDQAEDTMTIIGKYVDAIEDHTIDNGKLKTILKELYVEALSEEQR